MLKNSAQKNSLISKKLRSDSGASITFALLLFLVCAILSAVILVAGTTAAGRMSNLAETDQSYYSVTSAAELLKDELDGQKVSIIDDVVYNRPMDTITSYDVYYDNGEPGTPTSADENVEPEISGDSGTNTVLSSDFAYELAGRYKDKGKGDKTVEYNLSSEPVKQALTVYITEYMDEQGNVEFTIHNTKYTMKLQFAIQEKVCNPPADPDHIPNDSREISWHLTNMESAYDASFDA